MDTPESSVVKKFAQQVLQHLEGPEHVATVNDLILGIRNERLSEVSPWSNHELDQVELRAAGFSHLDPLDAVLDPSRKASQSHSIGSVATICAPSPFAWT